MFISHLIKIIDLLRFFYQQLKIYFSEKIDCVLAEIKNNNFSIHYEFLNFLTTTLNY